MQNFVEQAKKHLHNTAVVSEGKAHTYEALLQHSSCFAAMLLGKRTDLQEQRVAFMVTPGFDYVVVQWGIWRAGGIAVPLCLGYPLPSLKYVIEDTDASVIVVSQLYENILQDFATHKGIRLIVVRDNLTLPENELPFILPERRAMILYTSGTTSLPKGVVTTHQNLQAQITSLVTAWKWSSTDIILNVLPLHHVHGIVNVICCALYSGASCQFLAEFDTAAIVDVFAAGEVNVFMAVPTIYYKLIAQYESLPTDKQRVASEAMRKFRLMVSGSAALPITVMEKWQKISGHALLERYGMTEIGMAISNPYSGERKAGYVGIPLPGVQIRLVDEDFKDVKGVPGEVLVKGKNVFSEYWNNQEATRNAFTGDGWFKTDDIATVENGYYKIMGRNSVDIIKSGGYKISALEIEEVMRANSRIKDCAVIGLENEEWGELVAAAVVVKENQTLDINLLDSWMRERMPAYRVPRKYKVVDELPRNTMGKVVKNDLKKIF